MGGSNRSKRQDEAQRVSSQARVDDQQKAGELHQNLETRRSIVGAGLPEAMKTTLTGATNLAETGGFTPEESTNFIRSSVAPTKAVYDRANDENTRRMAVQGGYGPGVAAGGARLVRQKAIAGAEATTQAKTALAGQVRAGKAAGLDALTRYTQQGISALNDVDINELRNRAQSGALSAQDSQLLAQLAAQDKTLYDKIMQGVSAVGGAVAGIATGVNG